MAATRHDPAATAADLWSGRSGDAWDLIEVQSAALVRNLELLRRRGDIYGPLDQASYLLLRTLEATGPADINTLATAVGLDPSTAGRQIADMQNKGLVERTPDPSDRRRSIVSPTPAGRGQAEHVRRLRRESTVRLLAGWTDEELRALGDSFARFNQAVAKQYLGAEDRTPGPTRSAAPDPAPSDPPDDAPTTTPNPTKSNERKESPHDGQ